MIEEKGAGTPFEISFVVRVQIADRPHPHLGVFWSRLVGEIVVTAADDASVELGVNGRPLLVSLQGPMTSRVHSNSGADCGT